MEKIKMGEIFRIPDIGLQFVIIKAEKSERTGEMVYDTIWEGGFEGIASEKDLLHNPKYARTGLCISLDHWYAFLDLIKGKENEEQ